MYLVFKALYLALAAYTGTFGAACWCQFYLAADWLLPGAADGGRMLTQKTHYTNRECRILSLLKIHAPAIISLEIVEFSDL